jgi:hypothetical protein
MRSSNQTKDLVVGKEVGEAGFLIADLMGMSAAVCSINRKSQIANLKSYEHPQAPE